MYRTIVKAKGLGDATRAVRFLETRSDEAISGSGGDCFASLAMTSVKPRRRSYTTIRPRPMCVIAPTRLAANPPGRYSTGGRSCACARSDLGNVLLDKRVLSCRI